MIVNLSDQELRYITAVAARRTSLGEQRRPVDDKRGTPNLARNTVDLIGCIGELVVAKGLDRYWSSAGADEWYQDDDVNGIEVRCTQYPNGSLWVYPEDKDDAPYVLVVPLVYSKDEPARQWRIAGWVTGAQAKKHGWYGSMSPGRPDSYWLAQDALTPISLLR